MKEGLYSLLCVDMLPCIKLLMKGTKSLILKVQKPSFNYKFKLDKPQDQL